MKDLQAPVDLVRDVFLQQATDFVGACRGLSEIELLDPSRCRGWSRLELLVHVRAGLDEMAATAGVTTDLGPTHDAVSYWTSHPDNRDEDPVPHLLWLRRTASAYGRPAAAVRHLGDATSRAAMVVRGTTDHRVFFQGKVMAMGDFIATWVVELAVHQLDLALGGSAVGAPLARRTLEALAGAQLPPALGDDVAVLVGLGRVPWPDGVENPGAFPVSL